MSPAAVTLFARHLDLTPLGRRRRGLVRCRFHQDRTASLSVDLDRALFHCFGCGVGGGVRRFAALVGEAVDTRPVVALAPPVAASPRVQARRDMLDLAERQPGHDPRTRHRYLVADEIRVRHRAVRAARAVASSLGPSDPVWHLLALAARVEVDAYGLEAALDEGGTR